MSEQELEVRKRLKDFYQKLYKPQITGAAIGAAMSVLASALYLGGGLTLDNGGYPIISGLIFGLSALGAASAGGYIHKLYDINNEINGAVDRQTAKAIKIEAENQKKQRKNEMVIFKTKELEAFLRGTQYPGYEEDLETLSALVKSYEFEIDRDEESMDAYLNLLRYFEQAVIYKTADMGLDIDEVKGSR